MRLVANQEDGPDQTGCWPGLYDMADSRSALLLKNDINTLTVYSVHGLLVVINAAHGHFTHESIYKLRITNNHGELTGRYEQF